MKKFVMPLVNNKILASKWSLKINLARKFLKVPNIKSLCNLINTVWQSYKVWPLDLSTRADINRLQICLVKNKA